MPTTLLLLDNSRIKREKAECEFAAFLEYRFGPSGYGIRKRAQALPLMTGIGAHRGAAGLLKWSLKNGEGSKLPPREEARKIITSAVYSYFKRCTERGFQNVTEDFTQRTIREQCALIEGLMWGLYRVTLPGLLAEYRVAYVEEEGEVIVVGCTCGLGDFTPGLEAHQNRECQGIGVMSKPDVVLQSRANQSLYLNCDFKTGGDVSNWNWAEMQNQGLQFAVQCAGLRLKGFDVHETLVVGLNKGWRQAATEEDEWGDKRVTAESAKDRKQQSVFCWAYKNPGNPPLTEDEWRPTYQWKEVDQKTGALVTKRCGRAFSKHPVWEARFSQKPADWNVIEFWVEWLPIEVVAKQFRVAGPFTTSQDKLLSIFTMLRASGQKWKRIQWEFYELLQANAWDWTAAPVQAYLNEHVPKSWNCIVYKSECQFRLICDKQPGWEDPLNAMGGVYELRAPHHKPERDQAIARGIELPLDQEEFEDAGD